MTSRFFTFHNALDMTITLVTTRQGLVEKEQILRGKNQEFYSGNVTSDILGRHPWGRGGS